MDEVAASVMVMQRGTVFDDIAERVLKMGESVVSRLGFEFPLTKSIFLDPKNVDARYVHFFHEKIPSRYVRWTFLKK